MLVKKHTLSFQMIQFGHGKFRTNNSKKYIKADLSSGDEGFPYALISKTDACTQTSTEPLVVFLI